MFAVGDILNQTYRIERLLGEGGMARVYLVQHTRLPKKFALKLISRPQDAAGDFGQRFRREAEVLASLNHLHIVNVVDWNQTAEGLPYLIMEYLEGEDLAHFLSRTGALQPPVALAIIHQIGLALQAAHDAGVVHRDLKPGNIFLCKEGTFPNFVKVLDFGIAKLLYEAGPLKTSAQMLMGTPSYMSPEQAKGNVQSIDARSDQFSLATILYEMLSGNRPFCLHPEEDVMSIIAHVIFHEPAPLPIPQVGPALQRAMQKDPAARFASIREFVAATGARRAFNAAASPATMSTTQGEVAPPMPRRSRKKTTVAVSIAIGGLTLIALLVSTVRALFAPAPGTPAVVAEVYKGSPAPAATPAPAPAAIPVPTPAAIPDPAKAASPVPAKAAGEVPPPVAEVPHPSLPDTPKPAKPAVKPVATTTKPPERAPKPVPARTGVSTSSVPASVPAPGSGFDLTVTGASEAQQKLIRQCCIKELKPLSGMPKNYKVVLQRSGTLHIVDAPDAVRQTDLGQCLRGAFSIGEVPAAATVYVRGSR